MTITFNCEHCRREIKAPETAAGKRGKCPFCGKSSYIPSPPAEEGEIPLAPLDEDEERSRCDELKSLLMQEKSLLSEMPSGKPAEQGEAVRGEDLYHHVVNYCLDVSSGKTERAETHAAKLKGYGYPGRLAVEDFQKGKAIEPALDPIPARTLQQILLQLMDKLK